MSEETLLYVCDECGSDYDYDDEHPLSEDFNESDGPWELPYHCHDCSSVA